MPTENFYDEKSDWARRKHLVLSYYLSPATNKLRYASSDDRVFIFDGFAGRGRYKNNQPGSPVYTGDLAEKRRSGSKPLRLYIRNSEADPEIFAELEKATDTWVRAGYVKNINKKFSEALPEVIAEAAKSPLFVFLDPFRHTQLLFEDITPLLRRTEKTEICAVIFTRMIQRNLQSLKPDANSRYDFHTTLSSTLDGVFGNREWSQLVVNNTLEYEDILSFFSNRIKAEAQRGYGRDPGYVVWKPIYARKGGHMMYHMVFWTRHRDGVMLMNDAFAKESGDLEDLTNAQIQLKEEEKKLQKARKTGLIGLFDDEPEAKPNVEDVKAVREFDWLCDSIMHMPILGQKPISRASLVEKSILGNFGKFSAAKHRRAIQTLVDRTEAPRLKAINGKQLKNGNWVLNPDTMIEIER